MPNSIVWFYPSNSISDPFYFLNCSGDIQQCLQNNGANENDNTYLSIFDFLNSAGIQQSYLLAKEGGTEVWEPLVRSNSPGLQCVEGGYIIISSNSSNLLFLEKIEGNVNKMDFFRLLLWAGLNYDIQQLYNDIKSTNTLRLSIGNINIIINNPLQTGHFIREYDDFIFAFNSVLLLLTSNGYLVVYFKTNALSDFLGNIGSGVPYEIDDSTYSWSLDLNYIQNLYDNQWPDAPNGVLTTILSELLRPIPQNLQLPGDIIINTDNNTYTLPLFVSASFTLDSAYGFLPILRNLRLRPNNEISIKAHPNLDKYISYWQSYIYNFYSNQFIDLRTYYEDEDIYYHQSIDLSDPSNNTAIDSKFTDPFYGGASGWNMSDANLLFEFTYDAQADTFTISPVADPQTRFTQYADLANNVNLIQNGYVDVYSGRFDSINKLSINTLGYDFSNMSNYLPTTPGKKIIIFRPLPNLDLDYLINNLIDNNRSYYIVYLGASDDVIVSSKVLYAGNQIGNVPGQNISIPIGVRYAQNIVSMSAYAA